MKITLLQKDLGAAVSVPWSDTTCLIAQAITRATGKPLRGCAENVGAFVGKEKWFKIEGVGIVQATFDHAYQGQGKEAAITEAAPYLGTVIEIKGYGVPEGPALGEPEVTNE